MAEAPIQMALLDLLSDGQFHKQSELLERMGDPMADRDALAQHIIRLRERLRPRGETILTDKTNGQTKYRHVRIVALGE